MTYFLQKQSFCWHYSLYHDRVVSVRTSKDLIVKGLAHIHNALSDQGSIRNSAHFQFLLSKLIFLKIEQKLTH